MHACMYLYLELYVYNVYAYIFRLIYTPNIHTILLIIYTLCTLYTLENYIFVIEIDR